MHMTHVNILQWFIYDGLIAIDNTHIYLKKEE